MSRADFNERRETRIERMEARAQKAKQQADAAYEASNRAVEGIVPGQPILVGHHSEGRHRAALKRAHNAMDRSCAEMDRTRYWEDRARAAEANRAISPDDPDAIRKLTEKLDYLTTKQARMKAINAAHARYTKKPESLDAAELTDAEKDAVRTYKPAYSWAPHPFPPYSLSNLSANIRTVKARLESLSAQAEAPAVEVTIGDVRIVYNTDANRIQAFFPGKPSDEVRTYLKRNGFRWSPSEGAWQRMPSHDAVHHAREAARMAQAS